MTDVAGAGLTADRPFPGLRPFDFPDHDFFFGRDHEVYSLYRLVDRSRSSCRGEFFRQRKIVSRPCRPAAAVEGGEREPGRSAVDLEGIASRQCPTARLAGALASLSNDDDPVILAARQERIAFELRQSSSGIASTLGKVGGLGETTLVLVVDQFEELFRYSAREPSRIGDCGPRDTRTTPINSSSSCSKPAESRRTTCMCCLRCARTSSAMRALHGLPEAVSVSQFLVPSLTREQLEEVIRTPIERAGATIEGALVQRLLNDSGSDLDQLPVLGACLSRLWERAEKDIAPQERDRIRDDDG